MSSIASVYQPNKILGSQDKLNLEIRGLMCVHECVHERPVSESFPSAKKNNDNQHFGTHNNVATMS